MPLTSSQLTILKTDIDNNSGPSEEFENVPSTPDGNQLITDAYNTQASPNFFVWRTDITQNEINEAVDWSEVVGLTTNEMLSFQLLKNQDLLNASKSSIRGAFGSIFSSKPNTNAALLALGKRLALRIEQLLATGTGSETNPATMDFEGTISRGDVQAARNLP